MRNATRRSLLFLFLLLVLAAAPAVRALSGSVFEAADGDLVSAGGVDWDAIVGQLHVGYDEPTGQTDDSLGGKEDDAPPTVDFGSIPNNKSDLLRFYVHHESVPEGDSERDFLYLAWIRANTLGTANMDFEFNQAKQISSNGRTPVRTEGDILVTFAFTGNNNLVQLGLSKWTETGPCEASSTIPCWGPIVPLSGIAEGAVNGSAVADPVTGATLVAGTFGEAAIDLTEAGVFDRDECISFGSAYVKSRSSDSFSSTMKDFIRPIDVSVTNCATVTVRKNAVPDDAQDFTFMPSAALSPDDVVLDDDPASALPASHVFFGRFAGPQTVDEQPVAGWDLTDLSCSGQGTPERDATGALTGRVTILAAIGSTVDCTWVNTKRGRLVVDEVTLPGGDPKSFDFSYGGPGGSAGVFALTGSDTPWNSGTVRPGTYSVAQSDDGPEWDLASVVCSDGSPANAVVIDPGETVTCTFTNVKRGSISVDVVTTPSGDPQTFSFLLSGGPDAVSQSFALADATAPHASGLVRAGTYAAAAGAPAAGWDLASSSCTDGSAPSAISLSAGESVTCTFVYVKRGSISVDVVTTPSSDPQTFSFTLAGGPDAVSQSFALADQTAPHASGYVRAGSYAVVAGALATGWDLASSSCSDGSAPSAIALSAGESVTCTFVYVKRGTITVDVVTTPSGDPQTFPLTLSGGPDAVSQIFSLADQTAPHGSGLVRAGSYAVVAGAPAAGWDLTSSSCTDGSAPSAIALSAGESVTCTFVYVKRGTITVDVVTTPSGDPQTFSFSLTGGPDAVSQSFALADSSAPHASGLVRAGTYAVAAGALAAGWDLSSSSCTDGSAPSAIGLSAGESVTCTFVYVKRGTITVDVVTTPSGDPQTFAFTLAGGPDAVSQSFTLADATVPHASGYVRAGSYAATAGAVPSGWDFTSSSCTDGSAPSAISLSAGESVTCTFVYVKRGTIRVDVVTTPSGDPQTFSFALSGGPDSLSQSFALADQTAPYSSGFVRAGGYVVTAGAVPAGWDFISSSCTDGSAPSAVSLSAGETVTCTFVYVKRGTIRVDVVTTPSGDPQTIPLTLTGGPDAVSQSFALADQTPPYSSGLVRAGSYAVSAGAPTAEWDLTSATCTDGSAPSAISLSAGETVTCTFVYVKRAQITVSKIVTNEVPPGVVWDPSQIPFPFTGWGASFTLHHGESKASPWIPSLRSYSISESAPTGWSTTSECVRADGSRVTGGSSISVTPAAGEQIACTFYNELTMHAGSAGFWRNWSNHYTTAQFRAIVDASLGESPIFATLFDPYTGTLRSDAVSKIDAIYAANGTLPHLMRELTSTMLNIGVSTDPAVHALQNNDDICLDCVLDLDEIPGAETLLRSLAPCELPDVLRIRDLVAVAEAAWTGDVSTSTWTFAGLTDSQIGILDQVFGGINMGTAIVADVTKYPAEITCVAVPGPVTYTWYRDADGDGHGVLSPRTQTCDGQAPAGYAASHDDCDDTRNLVWPGAPEVCDGRANDCTDPGYPAPVKETQDGDGDGMSECAGDCNDADPSVYSGAIELCDGRATDCSGPSWPLAPAWDRDDDGDSLSECAGDCDDTRASVKPGAPQLCDGVNNNCSAPGWPAVPVSEADGDHDGYLACNDCNDAAAAVHPGVAELCNGVDDDCSGLADDGPAGVDPDHDGRASACDNCPLVSNGAQIDLDRDGVGDSCDNCSQVRNPDQLNSDADSRGDACDTCPTITDVPTDDLDRDSIGDACDNCLNVPNAAQSDSDADGEGDACDWNDGLIYLRFTSQTMMVWDAEPGQPSWTCLRGDLGVLKATGNTNQAPGSNPLAAVDSGILHPWAIDASPIPAGQCAFYLINSD